MKKAFAILVAVILICLTALPTYAQNAAQYDADSLLAYCTGYAGTAGSSLKGAIRAQTVLSYSIDRQAAYADRSQLKNELSDAYNALSEEQKEELSDNMTAIFGLMDAAFSDYLSVEGLLESAGIIDTVRPLLMAEDAQAHYNAFKIAVMEAMGLFDELLISCTGYAGRAGSSLKSAAVSCGVLKFCVEGGIASVEPQMLKEALSAAYAAMSEEAAQELAWNMDSIISMIDGAFSANGYAIGMLEDAGVAEDMAYLIETDGAYAHWAVFRLQMQAVLAESGEN